MKAENETSTTALSSDKGYGVYNLQPTHVDSRTESEIRRLFDDGYTPHEIAVKLRLPVGEVKAVVSELVTA